ncbi:MAG: segregation/condensation protein A [Pseudomonadales bacterium]|nr:segregation/condensation protein A [Pseudomonadales bacterium]
MEETDFRKRHQSSDDRSRENVVAIVRGRVLDQLPSDLYIPPEALEVFLDAFEGPLDLLLYLIRRQNLDILEIRVSEITEQYMSYIEMMTDMELELAGEYLVMAAMLAEIKSRLLLPKPASDLEDSEDPRADLIRRLQEYERLKEAAIKMDGLPRLERDIHVAKAMRPELVRKDYEPEVELKELLLALSETLRRAELYERHAIRLEPLSVRERMSHVLSVIADSSTFVDFLTLFDIREGKRGVIVTFLALMELLREGLVDISQHRAFAPIYVRSASSTEYANGKE